VLSIYTHKDSVIKECDKHAKTVALCSVNRIINFEADTITGEGKDVFVHAVGEG
jgi:hypothetical protein